MIKAALCLLIAFVSNVAISNGQPNAPVKTQDSSFAGEPFVIEQLHRSVRFEADGKRLVEMKLHVKVQSESAVRDFGLMVYPYMTSFETLDVLYVRVSKPDGSVVDTPASEIQDLDSTVSRQAPMYTDQREKHIAVKSLTAGDTLEADLRWTGHDAVAPGHFWYDHTFLSHGICLDEQLEINVPADATTKIFTLNRNPEVKDENSRRIYTLRSSHLQKEEAKNDDQAAVARGAVADPISIRAAYWPFVGNTSGAII